MILGIDCETTGLDTRHRARPFFVSLCTDSGEQTWYEWPVDPYTREVAVPAEDAAEITDRIDAADEVGGHNVKFDAVALRAVGVCPRGWPWHKTHDTTVLAHLVASNQPKDLTSLVLLYLALDMRAAEDRLGEAVKRARNYVKRKAFVEQFGEWDTAKDDHPGLPSNGGSDTWRSDYWLPGALYRFASDPANDLALTDLPDGADTWGDVLREYGNEDTAVWCPLFRMLYDRVKASGRLKLYEERRKMPRVADVLGRQGLTYVRAHRDETEKVLRAEADDYAKVCLEVADQYKYDFELPAGTGISQNLRTFCFDVLQLEPVRNPKAKTDAPSLDAKTAIPHYLLTLPEDTPQGRFVRALVGYRSRMTGLNFLDTWDAYALPHGCGDDQYGLMHGDFNPASTDTIRLSCQNPNAQQIGKKDRDAAGVPIAVLRRCFGPATGREWWSLDFANIELRIPAYLSGEKDLIDLFERADEPPFYGSEHLLNFSVVYPDLWERAVREVGIDKAGPWVKKEYAGSWYKNVKNGDFAVGYGAGDATADRTFGRRGARRMLIERFSGKEAKVAETLKFAERHGYVETIPDKTVDPNHGYPLMTSRLEYGRVKPTLPWNYKIQGTAGWVGNKAAVRCLDGPLAQWNRDLTQLGRAEDWFMCCYVHDELVFDFPKRAHPLKDPKRSNLGRVREIKALMERGGMDLVVPIPTAVSVEYHESSWAEGVAVKF